MEPKLSVVFITYNHEPFIKEALDSVLMQEVDFPYEIVVGEDCSTDCTRDILREYDREHPGLFKLLFRDKNLGAPTRNVYETAMACRGEYLAFLEGDDYWTVPYKLQRQVDFLDSHPEYMGTTAGLKIINERGELSHHAAKEALYNWSGDYSFEDYKKAGPWPGQTASNVCRNFFHNGKLDYSILYRAHDFIDDGIIFLFILLQGKIFRFDEVMTAHRVIEKKGGESWTSRKHDRNLVLEEYALKRTMMQWCEENVGLSDSAFKRADREFKAVCKEMLKHPSIAAFKCFRQSLGYWLHLKFGRVRMRGGK